MAVLPRLSRTMMPLLCRIVFTPSLWSAAVLLTFPSHLLPARHLWPRYPSRPRPIPLSRRMPARPTGPAPQRDADEPTAAAITVRRVAFGVSRSACRVGRPAGVGSGRRAPPLHPHRDLQCTLPHSPALSRTLPHSPTLPHTPSERPRLRVSAPLTVDWTGPVTGAACSSDAPVQPIVNSWYRAQGAGYSADEDRLTLVNTNGHERTQA
jgi:hypothetical protein